MNLTALKSPRFAAARWFWVWRLTRCLSRPDSELTGGCKGGRMLMFAGVAFGLLLVYQINAPALLHRSAPTPCQEQAALAACVVMGPKKVRVANTRNHGFTLIELSIVLVIIGLIVGGVLVGSSMIDAARIRAQIAQIEKYNAAVHTFQEKFGGLPGDLPDPGASAFGFPARGPYAGEGDGNGIIEGVWNNSSGANKGYYAPYGEVGMFWVDLSTASLIEGSFNTAQSTLIPGTVSGASIPLFLPLAKLRQGNYISVYSGGYNATDGTNYFVISAVTSMNAGGGQMLSTPAVSVIQASSIDSKIDDGLPQSGNVMALYVNGNAICWPNEPGQPVCANAFFGPNWGSQTVAMQGSSITCFDNKNTAGGTRVYSVSQSGGAGLNCALSFKFQ